LEEIAMSIIGLLVMLVVVGILLFLVNNYLPIAQPIKMIINVIVVLMVCFWLLESFGVVSLWHGGHMRLR
jgi:hypothetical protein